MGILSRVCVFCHTPFTTTHETQAYCAPKCRVAACRARMEPLAVVPCQHCGEPMEIRRRELLPDGKRPQKYCSMGCRAAARVVSRDQDYHRAGLVERLCERCGVTFHADPSHIARGQGRYCSRTCVMHARNEQSPMRGDAHPLWKGGRKLHAGYVHVWVDGRYVQEHRLVMERHLGRELHPDEVVHHVNHDRQDNRVENLRVMTPGEHSRLHLRERWGDRGR